jgi:3-keto-disaccharide hydrolase
MRLTVLLTLTLLQAATAQAQLNQLTAQEKKDGYTLLFNGKNLDGWDGDPVRWSVQDGLIVGLSDGHPFKVNTFLIYKKSFANFILKADIKLRNHNSGIQFRSEQLPGEGWMVRGYQADASEVGDEKSAWGNLYEERLRGRNAMKTPDQGWVVAKPLTHHGEWNTYEILADGDHIQLKFNGVVTIDTHDKAAAAGIIALQLHAGPEMRVDFRNIKLKELP